jgi:flagellar L-ring protein precursor FlgH
MKNPLTIALVLAALCTPCLAEDNPRDGFKQEQNSLDAPPPAPRGSLYLQRTPSGPADAPAADGQPANHSLSFTEVPAAERKQYRKHDIVTIVVSEESESSTTGSSQIKKTQDFDAALQSFLKLGSTSNGVPAVQPVSDPSTLPEVKFNYANNRQNDASQDRSDKTSYRIAATIVDIKPNGTLVLEATKQIQNDKEVQVFRLTGVCDSKAIKNNNVISTDIAELSLVKTNTGEVRDGTKRGWLNSVFEKVSPF